MSLTAADLEKLGPDAFLDELNENLATVMQFRPFADPRNSARTREHLSDIITSVNNQLAAHEDGEGKDDPTWLVRTQNFRNLVLRSFSQLNRADKAHANSHQAKLRELRAFAHELAAALDASDNSLALDSIKCPFDDITAAEWFDRRLEKRGLRALGGGVIVPLDPEDGVAPVLSLTEALDRLERKRAA